MPLLISRVVQKFFAKKWTRRSFSLSLCPRFMNRLFRQVLKSNHQDVIRHACPLRAAVSRAPGGASGKQAPHPARATHVPKCNHRTSFILFDGAGRVEEEGAR